MPTNRRILSQDAAVAAVTDSAQGLVARIDANDEDSIESGGANTGAAGTTIFDIANHDLNVPLIDKGTDLVLHLNASDTNSYESGDGSVWTDLSSDGNNGAIDGAAFGSDLRGYFDFDGTNDEVEVGADADLTNNTSNISAEVWFNADSASGTEYIFYQTNGTAGQTHQWIIFRNATNIYIYIYGTAGNTTLESLGGITQGEWTHVAFTYDGSNVKGYVNGTLKQTTARTANVNSSTDGKTFLGSNGSGNYFEGKIAVARYYKTALTASEIAQNFRANCFLSYNSIYSTDLVTNLDAANYTSGNWADSVGSNDGTLNNMTAGDNFDKELGNYFELNGSNEYISIGATGTLDTGNVKSFEFWFQADGASAGHILTRSTSSSSFNPRAYAFRVNTGNFDAFFYSGTSNKFSAGDDAFAVTTGEWTHVVVTIAGTTSGSAAKVYKNGIEVASGTLSGDVGTDSSFLTDIGRRNFSSADYFDGKIGAVKFHSSALTPAQVAQNYLATKNDYPNGHNGTLTSVSLITGTPSYIDFTAGQTSGDYIDLGSTISFPRQFSVTHWVNFHALTTLQHLSSYYGGGHLYYFRTDGSAGKLDWNIYGTGTTTQIVQSDTQNIVLNTTEWQLVTGTCDFDGTIKIYIDKTLSASKTNNATAPNTKTASDELYVGGLNLSDTYSMGADFGAFRFYDKELTSAEIDAIFDAEKATYGRS